MNISKTLSVLTGFVPLLGGFAAVAAPPRPEYIQFTPSATKGALYKPDPGEFPGAPVGIVIMHRNSNFLSHIGTKELAQRGFVVLAMNPRCDNNEARCPRGKTMHWM